MPKYRLNVGIVLMNACKKVLLCKRADVDRHGIKNEFPWQMPQGGVDDGEDLAAAALRELKEETSIDQVRIVAQAKEWLQYDLPPEFQKRFFNGAFHGQRQMWFLMEFLGGDADINLNTEHPEFVNYQWATPEQAIDLIIDFKKDLYRNVFDEFKGYF